MAFNGSVSQRQGAVAALNPAGAGNWPAARLRGHSIVPRQLKGKERDCPQLSMRPSTAHVLEGVELATLEGAQAEAEGLRLVERLLDDGIGVVCPERTEGGVPEQADADGGARSKSIAGE